MRTTKCTKCGKGFNKTFEFCPHCGESKDPSSQPGIDPKYERYTTDKYLRAASMAQNSGEYMEVYRNLPGAVIHDTLERQIEGARLGGIIYIGRSVQNGFEAAPIAWRVIFMDDCEMLLISDRIILSEQPMWTGEWSHMAPCFNSFYETSFNDFEKDHIIAKEHRTGYYYNANEHSQREMLVDVSSDDKVFILSTDEIKRYFKLPLKRFLPARMVKNVRIKGGKFISSWMVRGAADDYFNPYWRMLRQWSVSPLGNVRSHRIKHFTRGNDLCQFGAFTTEYKHADMMFGIRPAIWVKRNVSETWRKYDKN